MSWLFSYCEFKKNNSGAVFDDLVKNPSLIAAFFPAAYG
jgi:hypothetical protein